MARLTHLDRKGEARMVDVGGKTATRRIAIAEGAIHMAGSTLKLIRTGGHVKGDVLAAARIAGIMAAKRAADLIPLCHPLALTHVEVALEPRPVDSSVYCSVRAQTVGPTGVEIEALIAVQIALLTVYDMCKAVDRGMIIAGVRLVEKSGGRSGKWKRAAETRRTRK
ncbi:MAG: cyclic pyranopterin monophosphate synthase MoaC [Gammaproteobacteria bacterium]|nr:cyclic pyranopterin monophosphate synthase MoaC [Gammaproteobacteria bacterium]